MTPPPATSSSATTSLHRHPDPSRTTAARRNNSPDFPKNNDMPPGLKELNDGPFLPPPGTNGPLSLSTFNLSFGSKATSLTLCDTAVRSRGPDDRRHAPNTTGDARSRHPKADEKMRKQHTGMTKTGHIVLQRRLRCDENCPPNRRNCPWICPDTPPTDRKSPHARHRPHIYVCMTARGGRRPSTTLKNVHAPCPPCPPAGRPKAEKKLFPAPATAFPYLFIG